MNSNSECTPVTLKGAAKFLKRNNNFIILTHASPDGDTLGAAYALYYGLKMLNKRAAVLCPDKIPQKFGYFISNTDMVADTGATVIAVDVADQKLLGDLRERFENKVELCIDHHISNTKYAKNLLLDCYASATCEIIYMLFKALKLKLDDTVAKALYTGIATDTGCFKYQNVTCRTHEIAAGLYGYKIDASEINRIMFDTKSKHLLMLEKMVLDTAQYHFSDKCVILCVTSEMQEKTGCSGSDLEGIASISRCIEGVICGITVKQTKEDEYKISLRTYDPLNASEICKKLGGGGHKAAAGATLNGTLDGVKEQILSAVSESMEKINAGTYTD